MEDEEKKEENKTEKKQNIKNQSDLVTKESVSAVCALFSFFALLILCTRSVIFGAVGVAIHSFLMGVFGYSSYLVFAFATYVSVTSLFGVRLVKNKKAATALFFAVLFLLLILQRAITYNWAKDGYIAACFKSGENFPKTTVCGVLGGLVCHLTTLLMSKVGAIVVFSLLFLFTSYLFVVSVRKTAIFQKPVFVDDEENARPLKNASAEPVYDNSQGNVNVADNGYAPTDASGIGAQGAQQPMQNSAYGYGAEIRQRPSYSISANDGGQPSGSPQQSGFSPFQPSSGNAGQSDKNFLFGFSPRESYEKNLLFDDNANVNRRQMINANDPKRDSAYTPSYLDSYENSVNNGNVRPNQPNVGYNGNAKPFETPAQPSVTPQPPVQNDGTGFGRDVYGNTPNAGNTPYASGNSNPYGLDEPKVDTPVTPLEDDRGYGRDVAPNEPIRLEPPVDDTPVRPLETPLTDDRSGDTSGYRRHEYMDYFSVNNPRIFGDDRVSDRDDRNDFSGASRIDEPSDRNAIDDVSDRDDNGRGSGFSSREDDDRNDVRSDDRNDTRNALNIFDEDYDDGRGDVNDDSDDRFSSRDDDRTADDRYVDDTYDDEDDEDDDMLDEDFEDDEPVAVKPTPKPRVLAPYVRVPLDMFDCRDVMPDANEAEVRQTKINITETLGYFKIHDATISSVTFGPTVTRYNVAIPRHVAAKKVVALDQEIALSLQAKDGVNIYPNFEDGAVSIEVPNRNRQFVQLGCMLTGDQYVNSKPTSLMFSMGKDVGNRKVYGDICKMIHMLVAGSSGSGKSVFLGSLIISMIVKYSPSELRLILIDPKKTEFVLYNDLPHLMINEIITDVPKAVQSLEWAIGEMNRRYEVFKKMSLSGTYVVNIDEYNSHVEAEEKLPKIVIIIDELADLMLAAKKDVEDRVQSLTQKARAAGIHLIVATQRPSADVITGVIKANLPTRIAFAVASDVDSRVILDQTGAQKLLGKGDFIYTTSGMNTPVRVQSAFISPEDSQRVINFIKMNNEAYYDEEATQYINNAKAIDGDGGGSSNFDDGDVDEVYIMALKIVISLGSASIAMIQRKCSVGYSRAGKIIEWMEKQGFISEFEGAKSRRVLITMEEFEKRFGKR